MDDNRRRRYLSHTWKDENFTDVLVEMCHLDLDYYTDLNFK